MDLTLGVYKRFPPLVDEHRNANHWGVQYLRMFDMTGDSESFRDLEFLLSDGFAIDASTAFKKDDEEYVPLLEGKHIHAYTHRFATYEGIRPSERFGIKAATATPSDAQRGDSLYEPLPRYWVDRKSWNEHCSKPIADRGWCIAFRDVTNVISNARTTMATIAPARAFGNSAALLYSENQGAAREALFLVALLNSVPFDFVTRQKLFGAHLNKYILWQLATPPPGEFCDRDGRLTPLGEFVLPRAMELSCATMSLQRFARDVGWSGNPFRWNEERRFLLRCELDAAFFHLYLPSGERRAWVGTEGEVAPHRGIEVSVPRPRDAVSYVMDTFPIIRDRDVARYGEHRTKRVILEIYDEMQAAIDARVPYTTRLDPAPADPGLANPVGAVALPDSDDYRTVTDGAWARPAADWAETALPVLAAILKRAGDPRPAREVRLACSLALEPRLLTPSLDERSAAEWRRLVGEEAAVLPSAVQAFVIRANTAWGAAVRQLRGTGRLIEDAGRDTWAAGPGLESIDTNTWPDGRAGFVWRTIRQRGVDTLVDALPELIKAWVNEQAA